MNADDDGHGVDGDGDGLEKTDGDVNGDNHDHGVNRDGEDDGFEMNVGDN